MNYALFIAKRYLSSKRRTGFISLITYISAAGVMIGVAALVIVLSVANGFEAEVRERIIGADAHISLTYFHEEPMRSWPETVEKVRTMKHVTGASPYIQAKGMIRRNKSVEGAFIKGIDEHSVGKVSDLPQTLVAGELRLEPQTDVSPDSLDIAPIYHRRGLAQDELPFARPSRALPGIVLGRQLAYRLMADVGDTVIVFSPAGMTGILSTPSIKKFAVTGVFETGIFEYDDSFSYISLSAAQELFLDSSSVTGIEIKLTNMNLASAVQETLDDSLGYPYYARTWHDMHRTLFRWMKLEKWLYTILLSLIILVAAFNIVSSQIMIVLEKRREIGILKAIGADRRGIMRIFFYEGLIIGIIGTILGLAVGYGLCWAQQTYKFFSLPGDVYFLNALPVRMQLIDFVVISVLSLVLTLLATIYPARRAGTLDPVEAIRYE
ncbi:MAG: ABC transporter permease [Calditrichota bacterium]